MKRIFAVALLALTTFAFGATTTPPSLLNPSGSSAGQAIISTGPSSAPTWGAPSVSSPSGVLPIANGGTGSTSASAARTALGLGTAATVNTGTSGATAPLLNGANTWASAQTFSVAIVPSSTNGIKGTGTSDNAIAGSVGEYQSVSLTGTSLTSAVNANIASVSLTAGDWDVFGMVRFIPASGAAPTTLIGSLSPTSATQSGFPGVFNQTLAFPANSVQVQNTPVTRISIATTTTIYLVVQCAFSSGTVTADGTIRARRVR